MNEKRYEIVRVKDCPNNNEAMIIRCLRSVDIVCENCYGDTREDFVKKIKTVIRRKMGSKGFVSWEKDNKCVCWDKEFFIEKIAEDITEFLGVE